MIAMGRIRNIEPYLYLIPYHVHRWRGRCPASITTDELMQWGRLGLWAAAKGYKRSAGTRFETFANIKIPFYIAEGIRVAGRVTRTRNHGDVQYDHTMPLGDRDEASSAIESRNWDEIAEVMRMCLPNHEVNMLLWKLRDGLTLAEIGMKMGIAETKLCIYLAFVLDRMRQNKVLLSLLERNR